MAKARVLHMSRKLTSSHSSSVTLARRYGTTSPLLRSEVKSLSRYLEPGSLRFLQVRRFGANLGVLNQCDICGAKPPYIDHKSRYTYVRSRWYLSHLRKVHVGSTPLHQEESA